MFCFTEIDTGLVSIYNSYAYNTEKIESKNLYPLGYSIFRISRLIYLNIMHLTPWILKSLLSIFRARGLSFKNWNSLLEIKMVDIEKVLVAYTIKMIKIGSKK